MKYLLAILVLSSCGDNTRVAIQLSEPKLLKAEDKDNGVTCYRFYAREGVYCFTEVELIQSKMATKLLNNKGEK